MQTNWEDPFSEYDVIAPVDGIGRIFRTEAGLLTSRYAPDLHIIKQSQQRLLPYFAQLHDAAQDAVARAHPVLAKQARYDLIPSVLYRMPDRPSLLNEFHYATSGHGVVIEDRGMASHPLIDQMFPVRRLSEMTAADQMAMKLSYQLNATSVADGWQSDGPVRLVFPELVHFVQHWIAHLDTPITEMTYAARPQDHAKSRVSVKMYLN